MNKIFRLFAIVVSVAFICGSIPRAYAGSGGISYKNETLGFELTLPGGWGGLYETEELQWDGDVSSVKFYHSKLLKSGEGGFIFSVNKTNPKKFNELQDYLPSLLTPVYTDADNVIYFDGPTDFQGGSQGTASFDEYIIMFTDVEAIMNTFRRTNSISVTLDGVKIAFDQPPALINDRTLVPLRAIFEAMGADVKWAEATQTVTATRGDTVLSLQIGNSIMTLNGKIVVLDVPPQLVNSRTLVPARAIAEGFGADVKWEDASSTVIITTK